MSLFGAPTSNTAGSNPLTRSVSFSSMNTAKAFSFGASSTNNAPATQAGSLFSSAPTNAATNTTTTSGGLFGASTAGTTNTNTSSGGLFGKPNTQGTSTGLFGTQQPSTNTTQSGGGLFGAQQPSTNTGFGASASKPAAPGGLFGAQPSNPAPSGGLFGSTTNNQAPSGGLFGTQNNNANQGTSLFGASAPSTQQNGPFSTTQTNSGGLFGASTNTNNQGSTSLFGAPKPMNASFGASTATPAQNASPLQQHPFYQRERYNDLPEAQRSLLDTMEKFINSQTQMKHELRSRSSTDEMRQLMADVHELTSVQQALASTLEADSIRLQTVSAKVEQDRNDNAMLHQVATHARDRLSDGSSFVDWLRRFYERISEEDVARIQRYRLTMEQLERHLLSLNQREQFAPQVIADIIHDQNASFMALTEHVATLHAEIDTLKKDYVKWYQNRFQSVRDPFAPVTAAAEH